MEYQQSEPIAERRRWIIVLVDFTDGVTGKTGQTGQVYISKNGGTPVLSTNSIVEVDSTNMPGHYYIELTAGELSSLGFISITKKNASTLAFHDRAIVSYNNPYQSAGGFSGVGSVSKGITKSQAMALLANFRKIMKDELAKLQFPEMPEIDNTEEINRLDTIISILNTPQEQEESSPIDFSPVLKAIKAIGKPKDYGRELLDMSKKLVDLGKVAKLNVSDFAKLVEEFQAKAALSVVDVSDSVKGMAELKTSFSELQVAIDDFKTVSDKNSPNPALELMLKKISQLAVMLIGIKYDVRTKALTV